MTRLPDDHGIEVRDRVIARLGPVSSCFTLAWLASHRGRLRTLLLGGRRLSVLVIYDSEGARKVERTDAEVEAIGTLVYGHRRQQ